MLAPWMQENKFPIRSQVSKLTQLLTMTTTNKFPLQDAGSHIFVWRGQSSSGAEGLYAAQLASRLRDKMGEQIVTVEDGEEDELTARGGNF